MADLLNPNSTEARLAAFLRGVAARHHRWGSHDCGLWLAEWATFWRGIPDVASDLRGRYDSEEACRAMLGRTPYPVVVGRLARRAGLRMTRTPEIGSVGIVEGPSGIVGAICTGARWAVLAPHGFITLPDGTFRLIAAWGLPHG